MQYMGGKGRIASRLADVILSFKGETHTYIEPFIGGGFIFHKVAPHFDVAIGSDAMPDLVLLWQSVKNGWVPPQRVSREQYAELRHAEPSALRAFAGFGCSFGGKWFGGYASNKRGDDFAGAAGRGIEIKRQGFGDNTRIVLKDYRDHAPGHGCLVYCDPPYAGTTPYSGAPSWDAEEFWRTAEKWSLAGAVVLVSEYQAPEGWVPVWSAPVKQSLRKDSNLVEAVENLFVYTVHRRLIPREEAKMSGTTEEPDVQEAEARAAQAKKPRKTALPKPRRTTENKPKPAEVHPDDPFSQPSAEPERDGYGRYLIPHPETGKKQAWTRATTMAKSISDTYALQKWGERMTAKGLMSRADLRAMVAATPLTDKDKLNALCEDAKTAAGSKDSANHGSAMHAFTETLDRGQADDAFWSALEDQQRADLAAYAKALEAEGITILPQFIERTVVLTDPEVVGTFDRIVRMPDGTLRIVDLKTGQNLDYGWNEIAIQLAIYANAGTVYDWRTRKHLPMPDVDRKLGLVIHLPVGTGECTTYDVDLTEGWAGLLLCAEVRGWRKKRNLARMRTRTVAAREVPVTPLDRVRAAGSRGELAALWDEFHPAGLWSAELAAAAQTRLAFFATA